jgi:DUF218 domain
MLFMLFTLWLFLTLATTVFVCISGTSHKAPVLSPNGYWISEGMACSDYLLQQGITAEKLLKETASYDTIGNAYFSATVHALPLCWHKVAVCTSAFHMPRTKEIFRAVFQRLDKASNRRCLAQHRWWILASAHVLIQYQRQRLSGYTCDDICLGQVRRMDCCLTCRTRLNFFASSDDGLFPEDILQSRINREAASCKRFKQDMVNIETFSALSSWLHATHLCYAVARQHELELHDTISAKALATY